jgi:4-amino-4-deoxy-L-arabinose transferase-like glycosyltransferase
VRRHAPTLSLALLAVVVRVPGVWRNPLSQDEVSSARILREPTFAGALHRVVRTESTPPLWYALGWLAHQVGTPIVEVRLLSVLCGGALTALVYVLGCAVLRPRFAAVAAAFVAVGFQPVYHGSELRAYELLALVATGLCALLLRTLARPSRATDAALGATVWAGLLTHYFFAYALAAAIAWTWLDPAARAVRKRITVAVVAGGALAAPWLPAFLSQYHHDRFWWIGGVDPRVVVATPLRLFAPTGSASIGLAVVVFAVAAFGAVQLVRASAAGRLVAVLAFAPILAAGAAWAAGERSYTVRNLIETAPFLALAGAAALAAVRVPVARAVLAAAVVAAVAAVGLTRSAMPSPPYQGLARALVAQGWRPSDPIAVHGNFFKFRAPLEWYLPHAPSLGVSLATRHACRVVFVIEGPHGGYRVHRMYDVRAGELAHATLLASTRRPPNCVHLSTNPRLEPLA